MKPPPFDYLAPRTLDEALDALDRYGESAQVLAGGQSLVAMLNMRLLAPTLIVDISRLAELDRVDANDGWLEIGAAVTQARLEAWPELARAVPLLSQALPHVGHYQTRTRGTVCGSIAHADPSSELPLCLKILGGEVVLRSRDGERVVGADAFQQGLLSTAREINELIVAVRFPIVRAGVGQAFDEFTVRHGDFALIAAAASVTPELVRIGVGGCGDRPVAATLPRDDARARESGLDAFVDALVLDDDVHASASYRRRLAHALVRRNIEEAMACAS